MAWTPTDDITRLEAALAAFDNAAVLAQCDQLVKRLFTSEVAYPAESATRLLSGLRKRRFFPAMQSLADALILTGTDTASVRRLYAQSLLDQGHFTVALQVLEALIVSTETSNLKENAEARGLMGRAYKQMYVNALAPKVPRNRDWLSKAAEAYLEPYTRKPEDRGWHGINVVAVVERSVRDRVPIKAPGGRLPAELATEILAHIQVKYANMEGEVWDFGTAVEASLALGESAGALEWTQRYIADQRGDAFEFASTLRQLEEVWQLPRATSSDADQRDEEMILSLLRTAVLRRKGGSVSVDGATARAELTGLGGLRGGDFEKVFGADRFVSLDWYRRGLARCAAVARIGRERTRGVGTGFLVQGSSLHGSLGEGLYLLTNAHVISEKPEQPATITPAEAVVTFEGLVGAEQRTWRVARVVFSSRIGELDATLVQLDQEVPGVEPYPIATSLPTLGDEQRRVFVVGHPLGGGLSFSLQDNLLLDSDARVLHYRTPTEPGSSGSPVFNDQWGLIALHHAGRADMRKLNGKPGTYEANEGISILAIRDALARALAPA